MNNNFDYTSVPKQILYYDRRHLDDFRVEDKKSLNYYIEKRLFEGFSTLPNYEEFATSLFNCAYYILTVALLEKHPERRYGAFWDLAKEYSPYPAKDGTIALAIVLQQIWVRRWDMEPHKLRELARMLADKLRDEYLDDVFKPFFWQALQDLEANGIKKIDSKDDFIPQKINRSILKNSWTHIEWIERFGTDEDKILEFITSIGKNEDEQKIIAGFMRDELHSAFDNGERHKWFFEDIEYKIHKLHHAAEENAEMEAQIDKELEEEYQIQFELDYYRDEFPRLKAAYEILRVELEKVKHHNTATNDEKTKIDNSPLLARIAELEKENEELKAKHTQNLVATNNDVIEELKKKKQLLAEKEAIIKEQERLIEDYSARFDPKDLKKKKVSAMTGKQHIILFLAVLAHNNRLPNSRKTMSSLMSFIASRNESTMEDYLGDAISDEECEKLAIVFENETQPFIAGLIRGLPKKLEKDKTEKNRTKALKKNND